MGKNKRHRLSSGKPKLKPHKHSKLTRPAGVSKPQAHSKPKSKHQHRKPTLPFSSSQKILLIGEGDLSFARSLVTHHNCSNVTATVYESHAELVAKYPHAKENVQAIEKNGGVVRYGVNAMKMKPWVEGKERKGIMDRISFNFPHVGGKSKDVNRQVRYNQELLVSFFKNAIPSLSPTPGSSIIITLFEGEPYTLWNIRDLARHSGLEVKQSFRFQAGAYPGYKHARTLGVVKGKNGEIGAGWRGEERQARSFEFVRKGEGGFMGEGKGKKEVSSGDEEEEYDEGVDFELDIQDQNTHKDGSETEDDDEDEDGD